MDSKNESPISETTGAEQVRNERREATTSSNVLSFQENETCKEIQSQKSDENAVPENSPPAVIAESSNPADNKLESEAVSVCQDGDTVTASDSLTPNLGSANATEGSEEEKQVSKNAVSSQPSTTSGEAMENPTLTTEQDTDATAPSLQTAATEEKNVEPVTTSAASSSMGVEIATVDSMQDLSSQETVSSGFSENTTASTSSESEVLSLRTLANQKIIHSVHRSTSASTDEIKNVNNDFEGTIPVSAESHQSAIEPHSADTTHSKDGQTENEGTAVLDARDQEGEEVCEDNDTKASFFISSCSVPGMGEGSEWPSVSDGYRVPSGRPGRRIAHQRSHEPRRCLGTQRCHYVIVAIALLTAFIGCIAYHLSNSGIGPDVLRPIGASTAFLSFAVCVFSAVYINYLGNYLPIIPNYELLGDVESVMALNRASNPEFYYTDDGNYVSSSRTDAIRYCFRQTQSADVLDRRGYGRQSTGSLQTDSKRCSDESGTPYCTQPPKRFKAMQSSSGQDGEEHDGGQATSGPQHSSQSCEEIPADSQSSDESHESDTHPLLPQKDE